MLSREDILKCSDRASIMVEVPEWSGMVKLMTMTAEGRDQYEQALYSGKGEGEALQNVRASLVAFCAVDDEGSPLFTSDDVQALGKKSANAVNRLFEAAQKLNKLTDEDVEDLAKNSETDPSADSISD